MQGERSNEEKLQLEARIKVKIMSVECLAMSDVLARDKLYFTRQSLKVAK